MTIEKYLEKLETIKAKPSREGQPSLADMMKRTTSIWDNDAAKGYTLAASEEIGMDAEQITRLLDAMTAIFGEMSVDEAAEHYRKNKKLNSEKGGDKLFPPFFVAVYDWRTKSKFFPLFFVCPVWKN